MRFQPSRLALMAAAALTLTTTAAVAVAQDGPPRGPPTAENGGGRHHRFDPEARAQHLRDVLQLRADQDGALRTYLAASGPKDWGKGRGDRKPGDGPPKMLTTPERLDRETQRLTQAQARIDATRTFYAALSPSQRKAFDALAPRGGGHGKGMRHAQFRHAKGGPNGMPSKGPRPPQG